MTKQQLQQELKEKVKLGIKPSDLKKLKRSKSADDIANKKEENLQDDLKRWFKKDHELETENKQLNQPLKNEWTVLEITELNSPLLMPPKNTKAKLLRK